MAFTQAAVKKGYALTLQCHFLRPDSGGTYFTCGPAAKPLLVYVATGGAVYLKAPSHT